MSPVKNPWAEALAQELSQAPVTEYVKLHRAWVAACERGDWPERSRLYSLLLAMPKPPCGTEGAQRKISDMKHSGHPAFCNTKPIYQTRYAGTCSICGVRLPAGMGWMERKSAGTWEVFC